MEMQLSNRWAIENWKRAGLPEDCCVIGNGNPHSLSIESGKLDLVVSVNTSTVLPVM